MNEPSQGGARRRFSYANVMSTLTFFLVVAGGSAQALTGSNTVFSDDIVNGEVKTRDLATDAVTTGKILNGQVTGGDLAAGAVNSAKVADESLTGVDIFNNSLTGNDVVNNSFTGDQVAESSLSTVPSAQLGGYGFFTQVSGAPEGCNPNSETFVDCGFSRMVLPQATRVLVIATVRAIGSGSGYCRLLSNKGGSVFYTETFMESGENTTLVASINTATAGQEDYGVECNEFNSGIEYLTNPVIPLAVSPA